MNGSEENKAAWFTTLENAKQAWNICKVNNGLRSKKKTKTDDALYQTEFK